MIQFTSLPDARRHALAWTRRCDVFHALSACYTGFAAAHARNEWHRMIMIEDAYCRQTQFNVRTRDAITTISYTATSADPSLIDPYTSRQEPSC